MLVLDMVAFGRGPEKFRKQTSEAESLNHLGYVEDLPNHV
jgi:hypothetical protein